MNMLQLLRTSRPPVCPIHTARPYAIVLEKQPRTPNLGVARALARKVALCGVQYLLYWLARQAFCCRLPQSPPVWRF